MSERQADWPFSTPAFGVGGTHLADIDPQTSCSPGGLRRLDAVVKALDRDAAQLAAWRAEARPALEGDLEPGERRRHLRHTRTLGWMVSMALESLVEILTHMAACDALAGADEELVTLFDQAMRWNFIWAYRQEDAAAACCDPLENPDAFRAELRDRLLAGDADR